jgi:superfamily II DNA or RNA helicase
MTATTQQTTHTALLLSPGELMELCSMFDSVHVERRANFIDYDRYPLSEHEIKRHFKHLPEAATALLYRFHNDDIKFETSQIKKRWAKEKSGIDEDVFVQRALLRYLNETCNQLFQFQDTLKIYQRVKNPATGNYRISACKLSTQPVGLSFEVTGNPEQGLELLTLVHIGDSCFEIQELNRYHFLVCTEDTYYIMRHEDVLTLDWLQQRNPRQYRHDPSQLSQKILLRLEEKYKVERNNLFAKTEIGGVPHNNVFLSEINDAYLMLTPRWNYEGFMEEGVWKELRETTRNGDLYLLRRNKEAEEDFVQFLRSLHPNFARQNNGYFYVSFADAKKKQWFLKVYHQLLEQNVPVIGLDMLRHFRYSPHAVHTEMKLGKQEGNLVYINLKVTFGAETASLSELQKLLTAKQHSILLKDNSIGVLTEEWLGQYSALIRHGKVSKDTIAVPQWIMMGMDQGEAKDQLQQLTPQDWRQKWMQWQQDGGQVYPVPEQLKATLRPYQQKGFEWMALLSEIGAGACLADDMGLGKTLQTICFLVYRHNLQPELKSMIVCPASLIYNWRNEIEKFAPHLKSFVYNGPQRSTKDFFEGGSDIMICSYGTMRSDIDQLALVKWNVVTVDESQNIKNSAAQVTRAVYQLQAQNKIALSGTPVMNNTFDLYAQLQFLVPDLFGSAEFFRREYANPIDRDQDADKIKELQQLTAPFILRRTKKQVATDLPEKTESVLWCEMSPEQKEVYENVKNQIRDSIFLNIKDGGMGKSKLNILQGIQKLRQVCGAPQLLSDTDIHCEQSVKLDMLMEELSQMKGNKALVFSQFKGMLHLIADKCTEAGIAFYHFDGDTPVAKRNELVQAFQEEDNDVRVFLISLKSGNAGLTLTAADYVFLVDPWWNNAVQQQAIDRTHRIGQTKSVFAYKMICRDTIEEKIVALQEKKKSLSDELISEEDGFVKNLTEADVAYLFE